MPDNFTATLRGLTQAFTRQKGIAFRWFGQTAYRVPKHVADMLSPEARDIVLRSSLEKHLYENFYLPGIATPIRRAPFVIDAGLDPQAFRQAIFGANQLGRHVRTRWTLGPRVEGGQVITRDGLQVLLDDETYSARNAVTAPDQQMLSLDSPTAHAKLSPGHIMFRTSAALDSSDIIRFYWHILPRGAAALTRAVTGVLGPLNVPFNFKVIDRPANFDRCDAAVLYVGRDQMPIVGPALPQIHKAVHDSLRDGWPALTLGLAKGLAVAEDPGGGQSFGMARCGLLASALLEGSDPMDAIATGFTQAGLNLARPYLKSGSDGDWIDTIPDIASPKLPRARTTTADPAGLATRIADDIAGRAIWHQGRCTWMGAANEIARSMTDRRIRALDASVYDGTAGLAIVFAELAAASGEPSARKTALGAAAPCRRHQRQ
uniref:T3SS effector HopA1 family protein n=1 Tax=Yoonia rhodophyticola TaxID=3137370 RepID=A0AAN0MDR4_9RHOB